MGIEYAHMILNLLIVVVLIFVIAVVIKKFNLTKYAGNKHIKIINITPVGPKEKVILIEVNKVVLLLGATPNHIETLYIMDELEPVTGETKKKESEFSKQMAELTK